MRSAYVERKTKETDIKLKLNLDGGDIKIDPLKGSPRHRNQRAKPPAAILKLIQA